MRTYVRMMQVALMAVLAAAQSTTTVVPTTTTAVPTTTTAMPSTTNSTGVKNTTTAVQIAHCGFMWGTLKPQSNLECEFYKVMDYGWIGFFCVWWACFLSYLAVWFSGVTVCFGWKVGSPSLGWSVAAVFELGFTWFWPLAVAAPMAFLLWQWVFPNKECVLCCGPEEAAPSAGGSNAGASTGVSNASGTQTTPPLVSGAAATGAGAQFNQRFPKISPGDCRPKYSRVQTSAC
jgi:hypothetical protein